MTPDDKLQITCTDSNCPERKSVCCYAISRKDGKRFLCSECGKPYVGGQCVAGLKVADSRGLEEIQILEIIDQFLMEAKDKNGKERTLARLNLDRFLALDKLMGLFTQARISERELVIKEIDEAAKKLTLAMAIDALRITSLERLEELKGGTNGDTTRDR